MTYKQLRSDLDRQIRFVRDRLDFNTKKYNEACLRVDDAIHDSNVDMRLFQDMLSDKSYWYARMKESETILQMLEAI